MVLIEGPDSITNLANLNVPLTVTSLSGIVNVLAAEMAIAFPLESIIVRTSSM